MGGSTALKSAKYNSNAGVSTEVAAGSTIKCCCPGLTGEGTTLKVSVQMVSFVGPGMVEGYESGNKGALEGLTRHLSANS
jgi:hypothetical protein